MWCFSNWSPKTATFIDRFSECWILGSRFRFQRMESTEASLNRRGFSTVNYEMVCRITERSKEICFSGSDFQRCYRNRQPRGLLLPHHKNAACGVGKLVLQREVFNKYLLKRWISISPLLYCSKTIWSNG